MESMGHELDTTGDRIEGSRSRGVTAVQGDGRPGPGERRSCEERVLRAACFACPIECLGWETFTKCDLPVASKGGLSPEKTHMVTWSEFTTCLSCSHGLPNSGARHPRGAHVRSFQGIRPAAQLRPHPAPVPPPPAPP